MKLSHSISKQKTSSLPELTDVGHEDLTESMAEVKFLRNQSPSSLEFYKNMRKFSRELSQHNKFIRNAKINPKNHSYIKIQSKCKSFTSKTIRNLPKLSPKLIKYGIEMNLLREDEIKGLIVDPNKYSIFFEDQDLDSPYTINALKNLKIKQELITFPNFKVNFNPPIKKNPIF